MSATRFRISSTSTSLIKASGTGQPFGWYEVECALDFCGSLTIVVTKGTVSLAFSGTGKGIHLGVAFGEFVIEKQSAKKMRK